jgi:hypothetical protein
VTEPPAPQKAAEKAGTSYRVLALTPGHEWQDQGTFDASSAEQAIRAYVKDGGDTAALGVVAIPARSWKPVKVTVETKQTVRLG